MIERGRTALWDLNERCNLRCRYCYHLMDGEKWSGREVSYEAATAILARLKEAGVSKIYYVGGEPFLHRRFIDVLRHSRDLGITNIVTTNGTQVNRYGSNGPVSMIDAVEVSLDSFDPSYLKIVGRSPNLDRLLMGISLLRNACKDIRLISVITKSNIKDIPRIVEFARESSISTIKFQPVWLPSTNPLYNEFALTEVQMQEFCRLCEEIYTNPLETEFLSLLRKCAGGERIEYSCRAQEGFVYVDVNGSFHRCPSLKSPLSEPLFSVGRQNCEHMSLDCLSCFNLVEDFVFKPD